MMAASLSAAERRQDRSFEYGYAALAPVTAGKGDGMAGVVVEPGEPPAGIAPAVTRDFTVATFVVHERRVLLLWHRKLGMWLPPGGHIEPQELPDAAAVREVLEETGVRARLLPEPSMQVPGPAPLARPEGIQLERIGPGHEHIDLVYFAVPVDGITVTDNLEEGAHTGWYALDELAAMGVTEEVRAWAARAVATVATRLAERTGR